jgi:hypothetical protein
MTETHADFCVTLFPWKVCRKILSMVATTPRRPLDTEGSIFFRIIRIYGVLLTYSSMYVVWNKTFKIILTFKTDGVQDFELLPCPFFKMGISSGSLQTIFPVHLNLSSSILLKI